MAPIPSYMAFRLWFQANLLNAALFFLWFAKDNFGGALMIAFVLFCLGSLLTFLLVLFIHLLNCFIMAMKFDFGIRFFTLLLFQCALAVMFWACFYGLSGFKWDEPDNFLRTIVITSVCSVAIAVLINWSRFRDLEAEATAELEPEPERIDVT